MTKLLILALLALPCWGAWGNGYTYRYTDAIDYTKVGSSTHANFPALYCRTDAALAHTSHGGYATDLNGYDIVLTSDAPGNTRLDHEIERYDHATGEFCVWVREPSVSHLANTLTYIFVGNASVTTSQENITGVWNSNYLGVWHLPNGTTLSALDSTSNAKHGTVVNASAVAGKVDGGAQSSGVTQQITLPANLFSSNVLTLSAWVHFADVASYQGIISIYASDGDSMEIMVDNGTHLFGGNYTNRALSAAGSISVTGYYYVVLTSDGTITQFYINGAPSGTTGTTHFSTFSATGQLLNRGNTAYPMASGSILDEVCLSSIVRSADWILAEYNNQFDPSTFWVGGGTWETYAGTGATRHRGISIR
ncbi:MAG: LamG domain-containing protein [Planctomycetota bacterium]